MTDEVKDDAMHQLSTQVEETVEATGGRKVLMITLDFDLGPKKTHATRLKEAYHAAVAAADRAVRDVLLEGSVIGLRTRMQYDYRHLEGTFVGWDMAVAANEEEDSDDLGVLEDGPEPEESGV